MNYEAALLYEAKYLKNYPSITNEFFNYLPENFWMSNGCNMVVIIFKLIAF